MRRSGLAAVFVATALQDPAAAETFLLSEAELAVVRETIAQELLDPESTILSNVLAARDRETKGLVWVCGQVRGRNSFGGYAQPVPFIGAFATPESTGVPVFLTIKIADPTPSSELAVLETCLDRLRGP